MPNAGRTTRGLLLAGGHGVHPRATEGRCAIAGGPGDANDIELAITIPHRDDDRTRPVGELRVSCRDGGHGVANASLIWWTPNPRRIGVGQLPFIPTM